MSYEREIESIISEIIEENVEKMGNAAPIEFNFKYQNKVENGVAYLAIVVTLVSPAGFKIQEDQKGWLAKKLTKAANKVLEKEGKKCTLAINNIDTKQNSRENSESSSKDISASSSSKNISASSMHDLIKLLLKIWKMELARKDNDFYKQLTELRKSTELLFIDKKRIAANSYRVNMGNKELFLESIIEMLWLNIEFSNTEIVPMDILVRLKASYLVIQKQAKLVRYNTANLLRLPDAASGAIVDVIPVEYFALYHMREIDDLINEGLENGKPLDAFRQAKTRTEQLIERITTLKMHLDTAPLNFQRLSSNISIYKKSYDLSLEFLGNLTAEQAEFLFGHNCAGTGFHDLPTFKPENLLLDSSLKSIELASLEAEELLSTLEFMTKWIHEAIVMLSENTSPKSSENVTQSCKLQADIALAKIRAKQAARKARSEGISEASLPPVIQQPVLETPKVEIKIGDKVVVLDLSSFLDEQGRECAVRVFPNMRDAFLVMLDGLVPLSEQDIMTVHNSEGRERILSTEGHSANGLEFVNDNVLKITNIGLDARTILVGVDVEVSGCKYRLFFPAAQIKKHENLPSLFNQQSAELERIIDQVKKKVAVTPIGVIESDHALVRKEARGLNK